MSNEETINSLKKLKTFHNGSYGTAIDMAIKALEQQPCEDCISRKRLIILVDEGAELHPYKVVGDSETYSNYNQGWTDAFDWLYANIDSDNLPSVIPQTSWIPVSERLPEEAYGCIVTVMDTNPMTLEEFENIYPDFVGWDGENWNDADGDSIPFEVIAWMPLPEPYKAESEDEE